MIFRAVEDTDLIRRARRGDVEAYNLLISRWEKRVYNYLLRIAGDKHDRKSRVQRPSLARNIKPCDAPA